jgi:hypothetical protein
MLLGSWRGMPGDLLSERLSRHIDRTKKYGPELPLGRKPLLNGNH